ncbi:MAG: MATE family efflux transporter [Myxococcota bacterium]
MTTVLAQPQPKGLLADASALIRLSAPNMLAQCGLMLMGLTDTFMIGRISAVEMGGVALGNGVSFVFIVFAIGLVMAIEPLASQAAGASEPREAYGWYQQGLWAATLMGLPLIVAMFVSIQILPHLGVTPAVVAATVPYLLWRLPGIPFNAMYSASRSYLTSVQRTRPIIVAVVLANVANFAFDYVLLFELDMGAAGIGAATSVSRILMFAIAARSALVHRPEGTPATVRPDFHRISQIFRIGWPIGLQMMVEVGLFSLVGIMVARMGAIELAGHQIALNLASATFMTAVGLAIGTTTLVGHRIGAGDTEGARRIGAVAVMIGGMFMGVCGVCFLVFDTTLARLFAPHDETVVQTGATLLHIAALFSVSDGIQAVSAGALRGAGDTKWIFYANAIAHWLIAMPVGFYTTQVLGWGAEGLWYGLTAGLTVVAIFLSYRFWMLTKTAVARVG